MRKVFKPDFEMNFNNLKIIRTLQGASVVIFQNKMLLRFGEENFLKFMNNLSLQTDLILEQNQNGTLKIKIRYPQIEERDTSFKININKINKIFTSPNLSSVVILTTDGMAHYLSLEKGILVRKRKPSKELSKILKDHSKVNYIFLPVERYGEKRVHVYYDKKIISFAYNRFTERISFFDPLENIEWLLPTDRHTYIFKNKDKISERASFTVDSDVPSNQLPFPGGWIYNIETGTFKCLIDPLSYRSETDFDNIMNLLIMLKSIDNTTFTFAKCYEDK